MNNEELFQGVCFLKITIVLNKNELVRDPNVLNVTASAHPPHQIGSNSGGADWEGKDPDDNTMMNFYTVDYDLIPTLGIQLAAGRNFSLSSDSTNYIIKFCDSELAPAPVNIPVHREVIFQNHQLSQ